MTSDSLKTIFSEIGLKTNTWIKPDPKGIAFITFSNGNNRYYVDDGYMHNEVFFDTSKELLIERTVFTKTNTVRNICNITPVSEIMGITMRNIYSDQQPYYNSFVNLNGR